MRARSRMRQTTRWWCRACPFDVDNPVDIQFKLEEQRVWLMKQSILVNACVVGEVVTMVNLC